jgi:hypothetical protein
MADARDWEPTRANRFRVGKVRDMLAAGEDAARRARDAIDRERELLDDDDTDDHGPGADFGTTPAGSDPA